MTFKYHDSPLYFRAAREAVRAEQAGEYDRATKLWAKANRAAHNPVNQQWSDNRSDFCLLMHMRKHPRRRATACHL